MSLHFDLEMPRFLMAKSTSVSVHLQLLAFLGSFMTRKVHRWHVTQGFKVSTSRESGVEKLSCPSSTGGICLLA